MNLKNLPIEELELMSYNDLTLEILKENKKPLNTPTIFKEICNLLEYSEDEYVNKIGDYYTSLTTDKRFVLLDSNEWDIRDNHSINLMVEEDEENEEEITEEDDETIEDDYSDDDADEIDDIDEVIDDELDDSDIEDLAIIDEDELDEN